MLVARLVRNEVHVLTSLGSVVYSPLENVGS